jgi:hypothetical protein
MILAGRWEVMNRTYHGGWTNILQPRYTRYVEDQLAEAVKVARSQGAKAMLLTAPCYNTGGATGWPTLARRLVSTPDPVQLDRPTCRRNGTGVTVVNFESLACPSGHYQSYIDGVALAMTACVSRWGAALSSSAHCFLSW